MAMQASVRQATVRQAESPMVPRCKDRAAGPVRRDVIAVDMSMLMRASASIRILRMVDSRSLISIPMDITQMSIVPASSEYLGRRVAPIPRVDTHR